MTLEEAIHQAEAGDVKSMIQLGDFYMDQNTGEGISNAVDWYERAAERNIYYAFRMSAIGRKILGLSGIAVADQLGAWDHALEDWEKARTWSLKALECIDRGDQSAKPGDRDAICSDLNDENYYMGICKYMMREDSDAIALLQGMDETRAKVLLGVCTFRMGKQMEDYAKAYDGLSCIEHDRAYCSAKKSSAEEDIYAVAALQLSGIYRLGVPGVVKIDLNQAVQVLEDAYTSIKSDEFKQMVLSERNHYQKKLFGGYKYIG